MIDYYESNIDLTLLGCGFLGTYHIGAIYLLTQIWPHSPYNRICGSSCGGCVDANRSTATCELSSSIVNFLLGPLELTKIPPLCSLLGGLMVSGISLENILEQGIGIVNNVRYLIKTGSFLPFRDTCSMRTLVERQLDGLLPEDAHIKCTGRLGLSITQLMPLKNNFVSTFDSRKDLIEAIIAGCFIPLWSGELRAPYFRNKRCLDGAYTNNRPKFELNGSDIEKGVRQVELCPFNSDIEVSPELNSFSFANFKLLDTSYQLTWPNACRTIHAMAPCASLNYRAYLFHGHRDMKNYLIRNKLIVCPNCYALKQQQPDKCTKCSELIEKVKLLRIPKSFYELIR